MLDKLFYDACKDAKTPELWYVCLLETIPVYGGPEEGGWWTSDAVVVAYQAYQSQEQAEAVANGIQDLAKELRKEAKVAYGNQCLREMKWLDDRGLDGDWLREPDGPSNYSVVVSQTIPEPSYGSRHYE